MNWLSPYAWTGDTHVDLEPPAQVLAGVKFGQLSKNCDNSGICEVELMPANAELFSAAPTAADPCARPVTCLLSASRHLENFLELAVVKSDLCEQCRQKQFFKKGFKLDEDYHLPEHVCQALQLEKAVITKGLHPYLESIGLLIVRLNLKSNY